MTVSYQRHGDIGVIEIDNPPVNALSHAVRSGLIDALDEGIADPQTQTLVLLASGRTFIAGADIREFGKPSQAPILPEVITALEASPKPLIAVLHGTALGGGLEVALGCHYRVALKGTHVGLPEVKLGLLPGAGGTQRLPRLAGVSFALDMITSGRFVGADEALAAGIIDVVSTAQTPLDAGLAAAQDAAAGRIQPRVTGELPAPAPDADAIAAMTARLEREAPELFSPFRIVEAVEACTTSASLQEGLDLERALFMACMESPQRAGLIHLFFAARSPHQVPDVENAEPFKRLALIGKHPLFEKLQAAAPRDWLELASAPNADTELCILAPDVTAEGCPTGAVRLTLEHLGQGESDAGLSLVLAESGAFDELVNHGVDGLAQQRVALTLKALRLSVVVSRQKSLLGTLSAAAKGGAEKAQTALEAASLGIAARGECYRESDIDLLAVEALNYPRHLGGPHRQATLAKES
ncbi:enoyl-CoA hydratase/isomerase family protein [Halomonas aquamarina]|uniref:Enoyl-CoA hydratase/isomerase family protein n=1 Tax=Vreelandella aquamarina TaxID=77097 RepID=A0ACC5VU75_9GAMM|nr:enoyl-CoA hydratase/isomerase family protein [Halomonas aquamarina]MBZ5487805.1 enoyl-CoA hydratase/isomerase family protein [Halomonas aquamarina]